MCGICGFVSLDGAPRTGVDARRLGARLAERGLRIGAIESHVLRACTHLDVSAQDVERAIEIFAASL